MSFLFVSHPDCALHNQGLTHPESPARLAAIESRLKQVSLWEQLDKVHARGALPEEIARVHPEFHRETLISQLPSSGCVQIEADTALCSGSVRAADHAAGAVLTALERLLASHATQAFCSVRPPGHHAERALSMGFCLYNNVAIGVEAALLDPTIERVAVLDFDAHHCNGTIDIFKDRPEILICSSFQHPFYPFRYADIERPQILNSPLRAGAGSSEFRSSVEEDWIPALESHKPDLIFVSAGFDAHQLDPLARLELTDEDFYWISALIGELASKLCQGRVISVLEGGYHLEALGRSVEQHIRGLLSTAPVR